MTPYGNLSYTGDIGSPQRTRTTTLSPDQQALFNRQTEIANQLTGLAGGRVGQIPTNAFTLEGLPQAPGTNDFSGDAQRVEQATFDRTMGLLRPEFDQREAQLRTRLSNQGLPQTGEAYRKAQDRFGQERGNIELNAAQDAVSAGRAEQSRLFGLGTQARQQGINERQLERNQAFNELAAFLQGSPALQNPQFGAPAQYNMNAPDLMGMTNSNYQAQSQAAGASGGATAGLLGSAAMAAAMFF